MLRLLVTPAQGEPFEVPLQGDELIVGRSPECDLTIADRFMSRRHARLFRDGGEWRIEDLGSRNGTLLGGRPVETPAKISVGDEITLSSSALRLDDPERPTPERQKGLEGESVTGDHTVFRRAAELLQHQTTIPPEGERSVEMLQSHAQRLKLLNEIHEVLARSVTVEELLDSLLGRTFDLLNPDEAIIVLRTPEGKYREAARRAAPGHEEAHLLSETLIREVAEKGQAALILDVSSDDRFADSESIMASGIRSLIAAPLADADGSLGMVALNSRLHRHQFDEADMGLLTSLGAVAALRLRNLALAQAEAERRRLEDEVRLARKIQLALLPSHLPELAGWELDGGTEPSQGVSGDFYEVVENADGACAFVVADVSGKGISASLLTASIEALLAGPLESGESPERACAEVSNRLFERTSAAKYATAILARLEPATGTLTYTNAGHNPGLIVRASGDTVVALDSSGPPIGLLPTPSFEKRQEVLAPGDLLVLYTDGITEAADPDDEEFGLERLRGLCARHRAAPLPDLAAAVNEALETFARGRPFDDDRTLVLLRRRAGDDPEG